MKYQAFIYQNGFADPLSQITRIGIKRQRYDGVQEYLAADGTWQPLVEGGGADGGITLPDDAIEAIEEAIKKWRGHKPTDAATEVAVLREWLAVEQRRVDDILEGRAP